MVFWHAADMRADRLLGIVALLRQHGRLSAAELARRLEVTPRTIARDIDALSAAGVPVYAERGRTGGYALLPGYRPDVEDLQPDEARALFVAGGSATAEALGLGESFGRALRKLSTGLPASHAEQVGHLLERVIIDPGGWGGAVRNPEALETVMRAVQDDRRVRMDYRALSSGHGGRRTVDPWGVVLAGTTWYLIAAHRGKPHTYRISRIQAIEVLDEPTRRPAGVDLLATWREIREQWAERPSDDIVLRVKREQSDLAQRMLRMVLMGPPEVTDDGDEHVRIRARVSSLRGTVGMLLGFGDWAEAVEPPELRKLMVEIADEARGVYRSDSRAGLAVAGGD